MFTGLVEETGQIERLLQRGGSTTLNIAASLILGDIKIDDSISVDGVCLTVVSLDESTFEVNAVDETLRKTTLGRLKIGSRVNLERCLRPLDRLGGHIVQGHVDSLGRVSGIQSQDAGKLLSIQLESTAGRYVISEGSITVNGVSLTVARKKDNLVTIALIPHTLTKTNLGDLSVGDQVNIEVDLIAKYVENLLAPSGETLTEAKLKQFGYK